MTTPSKSQGHKQKDKPQKTKKTKDEQQPLLKYEDPDLKVVIRLLPPNMTEAEFLKQLPPSYNPSERDCVTPVKLCYRKGKPSLKPFEEPVFSRAYLQFKSKEEAQQFKIKMKDIVFEDADSGDQVQCEIGKPFFGGIVELGNSEKPGLILQDPLFLSFLSQRSNGVGHADLLKIIKAASSEKKKKKREKNRIKRASKVKGSATEVPTNPSQKQTKKPPTSTETGSSDTNRKENKVKEVQKKEVKSSKKKAPNSTEKTTKPLKKPTAVAKNNGPAENFKSQKANASKSKTKEATVPKKKNPKTKKAKAAAEQSLPKAPAASKNKKVKEPTEDGKSKD